MIRRAHGRGAVKPAAERSSAPVGRSRPRVRPARARRGRGTFRSSARASPSATPSVRHPSSLPGLSAPTPVLSCGVSTSWARRALQSLTLTGCADGLCCPEDVLATVPERIVQAAPSPGTAQRRPWWRTTPPPAVTNGDGASVALEGELRVATPQGEVVCHPAFELYTRLCRRYPPETVEAICWIPPAQVEEAARLIYTRVRCPTTPGADTSTTPTSRRRRARCRCSTPSPAPSTGRAAMCCSRHHRPRRSRGKSCPQRGRWPRRWASPSARSGQRAGASSAHPISIGRSSKGHRIRSVP